MRKVFLSNGTSPIIAGSPGNGGSTDSVGSSARLNGIYAIAYIPGSNSAYLLGDNNQALRIYNDSTTKVTTVASLTFQVCGISFVSDGSMAYVSSCGGSIILSFNPKTYAVTTWIANFDTLSAGLGGAYSGLSLSPDNQLIAVPTFPTNDIVFLNTSTAQLVTYTWITGGSYGFYTNAMWTSDSKRVYVYNQANQLVCVNRNWYVSTEIMHFQ